MAKAMSRPVETFSAGFEFDAYDELPYARAVAERHRTSHPEFQVESHELILHGLCGGCQGG